MNTKQDKAAKEAGLSAEQVDRCRTLTLDYAIGVFEAKGGRMVNTAWVCEQLEELKTLPLDSSVITGALQSAPAAANAGELPPLPKPDIRVDAFGDILPTDGRTFVMGAYYTEEMMREYAQAAIASRPTATSAAATPPKIFEPTPEMKAALEEANKTGALHALLPNGDVMFINRGEQPEDTADLNCPYCGGSGHKDDVVAATPQDEREVLLNALKPFAELAWLFDDENRGATMPSTGVIMSWPRMHKEYELTVEHLRAARDAITSSAALSHPVKRDAEEFRAIAYAPTDGTEVELLIYHLNRRYAAEADKENCEQIVVGKWIGFNNGGWTWHGMSGEVVGWRPIAAMQQSASKGENNG